LRLRRFKNEAFAMPQHIAQRAWHAAINEAAYMGVPAFAAMASVAAAAGVADNAGMPMFPAVSLRPC
jgi:hypothetical protein